MSNPKDLKDLDAAHKRLQTANERLREERVEYCRLNTFHFTLFPHLQEDYQSQTQFTQYSQEGFGDQIPSESQWWATHHDCLTYLSHGRRMLDWWKLHEELSYLEASKLELEAMQSDARNIINELSHSYLRHLTMLDLPNELLLEIFEHLQCPAGPFYPRNTWAADRNAQLKHLMNTRLVCRRFCELASQKLILNIYLYLDEESLERLEKISHHPTISKGVKAVRIRPLFYASELADFNQFVSYYSWLVHRWTHTYTSREEYPGHDPLVVDEMMVKANAISSFLERLASPDYNIGGHGEMEEDRTTVVKLHEAYKACLEKQELLMKSGKFPQVVASAMARMPGARSLLFTDTGEYPMASELPMPASPDVWGALSRNVLTPLSSGVAYRYGFGLPSYRYQYIADLVAALARFRVSLSDLSVLLCAQQGMGCLALAPDIRKEVALSLQHLRTFEFSPIDTNPNASDLDGFLSTCLGASSPQSVSMGLGIRDEGGIVNLRKAMGPRLREKLTHIHLKGFCIDLSNLIDFLDALPEAMTTIFLFRVNLHSGTWKQVLDALRKKKYHEKKDIVIDPRGGEIGLMSTEEEERIFGNPCCDHHGNSEASRYILGQDLPNPLLPFENQFNASMN